MLWISRAAAEKRAAAHASGCFGGSLQCDGKDYASEIESKRLQGVLFLNINSYAGGTNPWGARPGDHRQSFSDGWIEVVGITNVAQLVCRGSMVLVY